MTREQAQHLDDISRQLRAAKAAGNEQEAAHLAAEYDLVFGFYSR